MKTKFSSFYVWGLRLFSFACFAAGIILAFFSGEISGTGTGWILAAAVWLVGLYYLFAIRRVAVVEMDETGVRGRFLFSDYLPMRWEEVGEVGIGYYAGLLFVQSWIYFSKEPVPYESTLAIDGLKNVLKICFSAEALQKVQSYYHGEIKSLRADTKGIYATKIELRKKTERKTLRLFVSGVFLPVREGTAVNCRRRLNETRSGKSIALQVNILLIIG